MTLAVTDNLCEYTDGRHRVDSVSISLLPVVWPRIVHLIDSSLDPYTSSDEIFNACREDKAILWIVRSDDHIVGVVTTMISGKIGIILQCGGSGINEWLHLSLATIEDHFRLNGCSRWQMAGRKGWKRMIKFDDEAYLFTREL